MNCPKCGGREITTDYTPRAMPYSTLPDQQTYVRHTCTGCDYEFLSKSQDGEGEILLK